MKKILVLLFALTFFISSVYAQDATKKTLGGTKTKTTTTDVKKDDGQKKSLTETTTKTTQPTTPKNVKAKKPIKGRIASLSGLYMGGDGVVSKEQAVAQAERGDPIVFVVGKGKSAKIYFVYNTDGTFGGKNLAKYANNKFVGIIGTTSKKNALNFIIAEMIESMD